MRHLDDVLRHVEEDYDHAYVGVMDEPTIEIITSQWLDTSKGQPAWDMWPQGFPPMIEVAMEFEDEIQEWFLGQWEEYCEK